MRTTGSSDGTGKRRPCGGGRRTELKKIDDKIAREVTFSKRRGGLFRKASELSLLCGAEIAIIAYSPHGNPFLFGSPSPAAILDRFAGLEFENSGATPCKDTRLDEYRRQEREALSRLAETRKPQVAGSDTRTRRWWEDPIDDMDAEELERYVERMGRLMEKASRRAAELGTAAAALPSDTNAVDMASTTTITTPTNKGRSNYMSVSDAIVADEELVEALLLGGGLERLSDLLDWD